MANFPPRAGSGNQPGGQTGSDSPAVDSVQTASGTVTGMRTASVRPCPSCSALVNVHATICPNCGEQIATKEKTIRCRRCRHRASSNLVVCPHCGRDLQPATSRWLTWGLPLLAVLLLSGVVILRAGRSDPSVWAQAQVERVMRLVETLGSRLQPDVTISMIPAGQDPNDPLVSQAAQAGADFAAAPASSQAQVVDVVVTSAESDTQPGAGNALPIDAAAVTTATVVADTVLAPIPTDGAPAEPVTATPAPPTPTVEATAEPTPTAAATATQEPTSTATASATGTAVGTQASTQVAADAATVTLGATLAATPVSTRTAAASSVAGTRATTGTPAPALSQTASLLGLATPTPIPATPIASATPEATATPTPLAVHDVRRGDTLFEIAREYDITVEDLLAANGLTEDDVYTIQPGDELNIPAPTPEGGPTAGGPAAGVTTTATPVLVPATYTVRPGDTMLAIALRNGVTVDDLFAANNLTIADARTLQPGDELVIPNAEAAATATPTVTATGAASTATPTRVPSPSATPTPENSVRVDAPRLRSPENGTAVSCSGPGTLTWLSVPGVRPDDLYLVHLGYVNSVAGDGKEDIIWVITQQRPISATSWQLDGNLCGLAPNTAGKQWRWFVEVAETTTEGLRPVSPASLMWGFTWQ